MEAQQMTLFTVDNTDSDVSASKAQQIAAEPELELTTGWTLPAAESYLEETLSFEDACEVARAYGKETGARYFSVPTVRDRIFGFIAGLAVANNFDADEQEFLRNLAWTHSDIVLQARSN